MLFRLARISDIFSFYNTKIQIFIGTMLLKEDNSCENNRRWSFSIANRLTRWLQNLWKFYKKCRLVHHGKHDPARAPKYRYEIHHAIFKTFWCRAMRKKFSMSSMRKTEPICTFGTISYVANSWDVISHHNHLLMTPK